MGISGILTNTSAWYSKEAQIDLVIDRSDRVINLVEIKFSNAPYLITKKHDETLRNKIEAFRKDSKTNKAIWLTMITTYGLQKGPHNGLLQNSFTMRNCLSRGIKKRLSQKYETASFLFISTFLILVLLY